MTDRSVESQKRSESKLDVPRLDLVSTIGFNGQVAGGLHILPDRQHAVFPLGNTIVVQDLTTSTQEVLSGHTNEVTCIAVSKSGKYMASGQVTYMGFKADVIIWDLETRQMHCRLSLHKVKVAALDFSPNDKYLISLGGQDDGSIVVWNIAKKEAICGSPAQVMSAGVTKCVRFANHSDDLFVSAGDNTLRVWELDLQNRKIRPTDVTTGQITRIISCIEMSADDKFFYCGTTTGDVMVVNVGTRLFQDSFPSKERYSLGVTSLQLLSTGDMLLGAGDGSLVMLRGGSFKKVKSAQVQGGVTSIALRGQGHQFFVGTSKAHVYRFNFAEFTHELLATNHESRINDVTFPFGTSELFVTCSRETIRVWHASTNKELLRVTVPNMTCNAVDLMRNGKSIVSAWDDGKIRAFYPESGKVMYVINDAHNKGVTALCPTSENARLVSGGGEGQIRVWLIKDRSQSLLHAMKEHKAAVTAIKVKSNDKECVSSSSDGTCIIWSLENYQRIQIIFANTLFMCVCYHPNECQIIASGTDRKITYWEIFDGSMIREVDGSTSGSINGMDVSADGRYFVTGGDDALLKVWDYDAGSVTHVGLGHSAPITKVKICPNTRSIVSVSSDGGILQWRFPFN